MRLIASALNFGRHFLQAEPEACWKNQRIKQFFPVVCLALFEQPLKVAVLTGGNRGIGIHVLEKLLVCKMTVVLGNWYSWTHKHRYQINVLPGVRDPAAAQKAIESAIDHSLTSIGKVFFEKCDTGDLDSVRSFARKVQDRFPAIHLLINNGEWRFYKLWAIYEIISRSRNSLRTVSKDKSRLWITNGSQLPGSLSVESSFVAAAYRWFRK